MSGLVGPVLLQKHHDVAQFDCGSEPLNTFLKQHALANQANDSARTFVGLSASRVVGYYSLAVSSVQFEQAPERMRKGLARHPVPVILMARFGVDQDFQGQGVGRGLFKDAVSRCIAVSRDSAARAFMVHAKDEAAVSMYRHFGMMPCPDNPSHLYLLMKDIAMLLRSS